MTMNFNFLSESDRKFINEGAYATCGNYNANMNVHVGLQDYFGATTENDKSEIVFTCVSPVKLKDGRMFEGAKVWFMSIVDSDKMSCLFVFDDLNLIIDNKNECYDVPNISRFAVNSVNVVKNIMYDVLRKYITENKE